MNDLNHFTNKNFHWRVVEPSCRFESSFLDGCSYNFIFAVSWNRLNFGAQPSKNCSSVSVSSSQLCSVEKLSSI